MTANWRDVHSDEREQVLALAREIADRQ